VSRVRAHASWVACSRAKDEMFGYTDMRADEPYVRPPIEEQTFVPQVY
jgi:hypothetical protein